MKPIPYARQSINADDVADVVRVLTSPFLTQGPEIARFERSVMQSVHARYAVAVCNATSALHVACRALDIGPGDLVWTTPNSFVASANCALYCGADVDFVDIDPSTYNIDPVAFAEKADAAAANGRLPKALIAVHFAGTPCDLESLSRAARKHNVTIVEDASHALGATYKNSTIGDSTYSDLTVFSFHPVKIITTGEGGMVVTNRHDLAERLELLRSHGITRDEARMQSPSQGAWYYEQIALGFNYRITDLQAALGCKQMERLAEFIARRTELVQRYDAAFAGTDIGVPIIHEDRRSAWHLYVIQVEPKRRRSIFDQLRAADILVNVHYIPIHWQPYYTQLGFRHGDFPQSERYYDRAISLPMFFELTNEDQDRVVRTVIDTVRGVTVG